MNNTYKVYVRPADNGDIIEINSSAFLPDTAGWFQIDEGVGDRYHHAQGHYFDRPIVTLDGIYRYRLVGGEIVEKSEQEIADEIAALPPPEPTAQDDLLALAIDHEYRLTLLELGV